ncbi:RDD family protein [Pontimicrobium sp. IMCC45349]|uniref:RDD family protein n=1 Tax=Pontimicrobium sp. IMCC45349 TaxID=3391574 RepID=UPI0039A32603
MQQTTFTVTPDLYSSKGKRFANYIVDYVIQMVLGMVLGILIAFHAEWSESYYLYDMVIEDESRLSDYIFGIVLLLIYYTTIEFFTKGRSVGKYLTKTKVVLIDGSELTFSDVFVRTLCRIIPFEAFSFLGQEGKGWHDSISKTYVVDIEKFEEKKQSFSEIEQIGLE